MEQPLQTLQLNTRLSDKSWVCIFVTFNRVYANVACAQLGDDWNEEDPFAEVRPSAKNAVLFTDTFR